MLHAGELTYHIILQSRSRLALPVDVLRVSDMRGVPAVLLISAHAGSSVLPITRAFVLWPSSN